MQDNLSITSTVLRRPKERKKISGHLETRKLDYVATRKSSRKTLDVNTRISGEKDSRKETQQVRRSVRISVYKENNKRMTIAEAKPITRKAKSDISLLASKGASKADHNKFILDILNTRTHKELKQLPMVGVKTAFQIVTYRSVKGKFKKIDELKNLVAFQGTKTWEKFLKVKIDFLFTSVK